MIQTDAQTFTEYMSTTYLQINTCLIDMVSGELRHFNSDLPTSLQNDVVDRLEPKSLQCLHTLIAFKTEIVDKAVLLENVWPGQIVTDDALTRCISRLRKALRDNPKKPEIIETIPKRGYRLVAHTCLIHEQDNKSAGSISSGKQSLSPSLIENLKYSNKSSAIFGIAVLIFIISVGLTVILINEEKRTTDESLANDNSPTLLDNADDHYFKIRRQDNEMAIELYKQVIALRPDSGLGQAGLANALVQQVIRWPNEPGTQDLRVRNLQHALSMPYIQTEENQKKLARALSLAERATKESPDEARTYKALGFVHSAKGNFELARAHYKKAVSLDPNAWDALLNIGDTLEIEGRLQEAIEYYILSFEAMTVIYKEQSSRIALWYADLGASIGDKFVVLDQLQDAEAWYRHVLSIAPFNANATLGLAKVLSLQGDIESANKLCSRYRERIGGNLCLELG